MIAGVQWLIRAFGRPRGQLVAAAYRELFAPSRPEARRVLSDLARYCRVAHTSFVAGDPHQTAFNEGARDVFLHISEMTGLRPEDFLKLLEDDGHE